MIYQDAINNGHTAMYLSESEIAGDLFYMELGNLPARTAAKLSFSYVQELDLSRDKIGTFMLPTVINPRYMPEYSKIISIIVACHWVEVSKENLKPS